ncbi:hypothetical protein L210DRAFT_3541061, partial [Boletus edulis BED1]
TVLGKTDGVKVGTPASQRDCSSIGLLATGKEWGSNPACNVGRPAQRGKGTNERRPQQRRRCS